MNALEQLIESLRRERAVDSRIHVFDVRVEAGPDGVVLVGETTELDAAEELASRTAELLGVPVVLDRVLRLPDPALHEDAHAFVRSALAPIYLEPHFLSAQISQYVLGRRLEILSRRGRWWRVRGEDGYLGWTHAGYLETGDAMRLGSGEGRQAGEAAVALGAELVDADGGVVARLPWGARVVVGSDGSVRLPDGRRGVVRGEVLPLDEAARSYPRSGSAVARSALLWLGAPYLWGGVTPAGVDCSGLVQSVYWLHGEVLPRDSDLQALRGTDVEAGLDLGAVLPGDLLFFGEHPGEGAEPLEHQARVTHVAISLGESRFVHSSLTTGGVAVHDLLAGDPLSRRLRAVLMHVRRLFPA